MATRRLIVSLGAVALLAFVARPGEAQTEPRLVAAVQLAQNGLPDSARAIVQRLQSATEPTDSLYPQILYAAGLVAATEHDRGIHLRRVVVEYSTSAWADDALFLLGMVAYANGNPGSALAQFARVVSDYPTSPLIAQAAFWGARAAGDLQNAAEACRLADLGLAANAADVELKNQLEYQRQRCSALATMTRDSSKPTAVAPTEAPRDSARTPAKPAAPAPATKGIWVQAIAAPTQANADETVAKLKRAGFEAQVVREGGFFKVRAGPFPSRAAATTALATIRTRIGGKPFIVVVDQ